MELAITTAIESLGQQQSSVVVPWPSTVALLFDHLGAGKQHWRPRRFHHDCEERQFLRQCPHQKADRGNRA
jgi:hypothetical protein